jgi:hypothetical protein
LNPGASEVMKGFIYVKADADKFSMPKLWLKDRFGNEIGYDVNPIAELKFNNQGQTRAVGQ